MFTWGECRHGDTCLGEVVHCYQIKKIQLPERSIVTKTVELEVNSGGVTTVKKYNVLTDQEN